MWLIASDARIAIRPLRNAVELAEEEKSGEISLRDIKNNGKLPETSGRLIF